MRLFLASEELGNHAAEFRRLVGDGGKVLVVSNARDYYDPARRLAMVEQKMAVFTRNGFSAIELDLRPYFGKPEKLKAYIDDFQPDAIYCIGGNCFLLNTALHLSGLYQIILDGVASDRFVYSGYSAGVMVASKTLKYFGHGHLNAEAVSMIYGVDAVFEGLGLIDEYITAHADVPEHSETTRMYNERITTGGDVPIALNQSAVYVVDGEEKKILP